MERAPLRYVVVSWPDGWLLSDETADIREAIRWAEVLVSQGVGATVRVASETDKPTAGDER